MELVLSDWASRLEVLSIVVDELDCLLPLDAGRTSHPEHSVRALFIGDSITCGFVDDADVMEDEDGNETTLLPRGCWDAYPYVTENLMRTQYGVSAFETEIAAYPGATLVEAPPREEDGDLDFDEPEDDDDFGFDAFDANCALSVKFFHASPMPFHDETARLDRAAPHILIIALGTNDEDLDIKPVLFDDTLEAFVSRLALQFKDTLSHVVILRPFPFFRTYTLPEWPTLASRDLSGVVDRLQNKARDELGIFIKLHVWDIADVGYDELHTIDGTHPTLSGHNALGRNLAAKLDAVLGQFCDSKCRLCQKLKSVAGQKAHVRSRSA